jgi:hypothetical protein
MSTAQFEKALESFQCNSPMFPNDAGLIRRFLGTEKLTKAFHVCIPENSSRSLNETTQNSKFSH